MRRPRSQTIRDVINYLESIDLAIYGPCVHLDSGLIYPSQMDYDADDVIKYRNLYEKDQLEYINDIPGGTND